MSYFRKRNALLLLNLLLYHCAKGVIIQRSFDFAARPMRVYVGSKLDGQLEVLGNLDGQIVQVIPEKQLN